MRPFSATRIDPTEPLYDGEARMADALAVLTASSNLPANIPTVQAKVPTVTANATRHARGFHMGGQQVARRSLRHTPRMGATRFTRMRNTFEASASPRANVQRDTRISSAMLMASSRRMRGPVTNRAQELDRIRSRANAQATVNTLRHRWNIVNRVDLSDGVANNNHLRRHARNYNREKNNKLTPTEVAILMFG